MIDRSEGERAADRHEVPTALGAAGHDPPMAGTEGGKRTNGARAWRVRLVKLLAVVVITWGLFRAIGVNLAEIDRNELEHLRPALVPLLASTVALLAAYVGQALVWRRIVGDLGGQRPAPGAALRVYFLSVLGRYVPGRVWQIAGIALLAEKAGISAFHAVSAAVLGQFVFLLAGVPFLVALLPGWAGTVPAIAVAGAAALVIVILHRLGRRNPPAGERGRLKGPWRRLAPTLEMAGRIRLRHLFAWAASYAALWALIGLAFALFVTAFAPEAGSRSPFLAGTMVASYLAGYLVLIAPAGLGVREGIMGVLLAQVAPAPAAILIALLSRIWFTVAELLPLAVIPFLRSSGVRDVSPPISQNSP